VADKDTPYSAEWTKNLQHRPNPNRVRETQSPPTSDFMSDVPAPADTSSPPTRAHPPQPRGEVRKYNPQSQASEPGYYDVPMLKAPLWKWEIASYFFLGGLSAGAYLLGRVADRHGGKRHQDIAKMGAYLALAAILPAPPLLIHDLGDPKRFHHMLRIWKPGSPMNFGSWALTAYSGMATFEVVRQYLLSRGNRVSKAERAKVEKLMNNGTLLLLHDAAGIPFALIVASYTGVLLSCTSNPLWCKNPWLSPLFTASAISTGAEAISLALDCTGDSNGDGAESPSQRILKKVDSAAHAVEGIALAGYMRAAGEKAAALKTGRMAKYHHFTQRGMIAAEIIKAIPFTGRLRKVARMIAAALGLAAGWSMRWSFIHGGHEAADDPHTSRLPSRGE
jgi:formate-dependent nitrite reductase membrane component NrfD